ncbi:hypothetical protein [Sphingomonas sp.]|uniref:hypothetical protein n=1 Tax=Sphingomonas sp. TaxID=28214 RepID=UPI003B00C987
MFKDDRSYLQHRAEMEIVRAQQATQPCAATAHRELAKAYLDRLASLDLVTAELA